MVFENYQCVPAQKTDGNHFEVLISGLIPDSSYLYSVDGIHNPTFHFHTAPKIGTLPKGRDIRVWILGDSGTASEKKDGKYSYPWEARAVLDGFLSYSAKKNETSTDLILMLGDSAYPNGTDTEWQKAVFDLYRTQLAQTALWPTIGNHEMGSAEHVYGKYGVYFGPGSSTSSDPDSYIDKLDSLPQRMPYLNIFSLPTTGEMGGAPSKTEQYYSFNYGNLHVVSLDSQLSIRDDNQRRMMKEWLIADLSENQQTWTIVIFHHPPYTKGSHDSNTKAAKLFDLDTPIIKLREEFTPVFEEYNVDIVYSGHSHSYERSYYLSGHRSDANSYVARENAKLNANDQPATGYGDEVYYQVTPQGKRSRKVLYTVAGSSGHVSLERGVFGTGKLDHPAHIVQKYDPQLRHGLAELGSVVLNVTKTELTSRFINQTGLVLDTVIIRRRIN